MVAGRLEPKYRVEARLSLPLGVTEWLTCHVEEVYYRLLSDGRELGLPIPVDDVDVSYLGPFGFVYRALRRKPRHSINFRNYEIITPSQDTSSGEGL